MYPRALLLHWAWVVLGLAAGVGALAGVGLVFFAPGRGVVSLIIALILAMMSFSLKRKHDSVRHK